MIRKPLSGVDYDLWWAVGEGDMAGAQAALAQGADVNAAEEEHGQTALKRAAYYGHIEMVRLLLENGADMSRTDDAGGGTALHDAAYSGHANIVRLLMEHGADMTVIDFCGGPPIESAVGCEVTDEAKRKEVIEAFLEAGYDINRPNPTVFNESGGFGKTLLMVAAESAADGGNLSMIYFLVSKGADVLARDSEGRAATDWAAIDPMAKHVHDVQRYLASLNKESLG